MYLRDVATHPNRRRLLEVVYDQLAQDIREVEPEERLRMVKQAAQKAELIELTSEALTLGVARYLRDHPDAAERAEDWIDGAVERWRNRPTDEIKAEATRRLDELEAWKEAASRDFPALWETGRTDYIQAKFALQSARSGAFGSSFGNLGSFLRTVGASSNRLRIS